MGEPAGHRQQASGASRAAKRFVAAAVIAALAVALALGAPAFAPGLFPVYRAFSRGAMGALATICSFAPVAIWDIAAVGIAAGIVIALAASLAMKKHVGGWLSGVALALACAALWAVGGWALNHYAPGVAEEIGLDVREYTTQELAQATQHYLDKAADLAEGVSRNSDGTLQPQDFQELAAIAGESFKELGRRYPVFDGCTLPVKELSVLGDALLYSGSNGIFMPLTGEASVPADCAPADMPFTMCHEASHRLGIAAEDEANFAAFLACSQSDDARFRYAGAYQAFTYCYNALFKADPDAARALFTAENADRYQLVIADLISTNVHYERYDGPASDAGQAVNDTYLRAFSEEGVQSYGLVADYLIAWKLALSEEIPR